MLAIVYKNLIETRKSLLILLGGISFIFVDFFISLIITTDNSDDKNLIVSVLLGLGMVCTYLILSQGQSSLVGCDQTSRFYGFIFSAPNGRFKFIAAKYVGMFLLSAVETLIFVIAIKLLDCGMSPLVPVILTLFQLTMRALETPFLITFGEKVGGSVKGCIFGGIAMVIVIYQLYGDNTPSAEDIISWAANNLFKILGDKNTFYLWLGIIAAAVLALYTASMFLSFLLSKRGAVRFADSETE